ncbi:lumenal Hsp70 protein, partial [Coemansia sp. RSA 2705]
AEARFNVSNPALAEFAADAAAWDAESAARDSESDAAPLRARPTPPPATVVETVALALDVTRHGPPRMSDAAREHARDLLRRMDADDAARVARSGAANQLESLVYHLRDIADDDDVAAVTTPAQRAALARALDAAADWLDANAELAPVAEIERQIAELRALEEPIAFRAAQLATRPARIAALRAAIAQAEDFAAQLRDQYAPKDLEPVARALEALEDSLDSTLAWLDALVAKQDALAPSDDPALTTNDLDAKARAVERSLAEVAAIAIKKASAESASAPQPETAAESELEPESEHTAPAAGHDEL